MFYKDRAEETAELAVQVWLKMAPTVVTRVQVTPPPTHCALCSSTVSTHQHQLGKLDFHPDISQALSLLRISVLKLFLGEALK